MPRTKVEFQGASGESLAGLLEYPKQKAAQTVLFAHCFSCGKDIAAASRISRALVAKGLAVLRFDFTGLAIAMAISATPTSPPMWGIWCERLITCVITFRRRAY